MLHKILSLLALITLFAEEIQHRIMLRRGKLPSAPTEELNNRVTPDRFDVLRLMELFFLSLILSTPAGNPAATQGQLSMILVGLQISRLFGRRILSRWSVLGVLQGLEIFLLVILVLLPFNPDARIEVGLSWDSLLALTGGVLYGIFLSLCTAFSLSYGIKLFSRESSLTYDTFPPLADSENWAVRFATACIYPGAAGAAGLFLISGFSAASILFCLSVLSHSIGLLLSRRPNYSGHHPVSHILWGLAFLLVIALMISGAADFSSS